MKEEHPINIATYLSFSTQISHDEWLINCFEWKGNTHIFLP